MNTRNTTIVVLLIILSSVVAGIYVYPQVPDQVASHWNAQGEADGYMPKFWGLFFLPMIMAVVVPIALFIPNIDPLKKNIEQFRSSYNGLIAFVTLFLFIVYIFSLLWNIGIKINIALFLSPAFGALFFYLGHLMQKTKRNWFIGIRTPWTLSSDRVWNKTHTTAGKLFKVAGVITLLGTIFQDYVIYLVLIPVISVVLYSAVLSYIEYQKEKRNA